MYSLDKIVVHYRGSHVTFMENERYAQSQAGV